MKKDSSIKPKDYFGYSRLIHLAAKSLPEAKRWVFIEGVAGFGFDCKEPNFSDPELVGMWHNVRPSMAKGWELAEAGSAGGKKAKATPSKPPKNSTPKPPKNGTPPPPLPNLPPPNAAPPTPEFKDWLSRQGFKNIQNVKAPLNASQLNYLFEYFGESATTSILRKMDKAPQKLEEAKMTAFKAADYSLSRADIAFQQWYKNSFEWLAETPESHKLRFSQYADLRAKYGRANVIKTLVGMNDPAHFNNKVVTADVLEKRILHNINSPAKEQYRLKPYNDESEECGKAFPAGFDKGFDYHTQEKDFLPKYQHN